MLGRKKGAFSFNHSLHTSFFEVMLNYGRGEGLVGDVLKRFGDLDSIFCPSSSDKLDSIMNVGRGKLCWMTTR